MSHKKYNAMSDDAIETPVVEVALEEVVEPERETVIVSNEIADQNKEPVNETGFCVYIGPTIIGVIQNGTIYNGTVEDAKAMVDYAIKKYPDIALFIVRDCEVAEKRREIKTEGCFLNNAFRKFATKK